jgi:hypothetical protein
MIISVCTSTSLLEVKTEWVKLIKYKWNFVLGNGIDFLCKVYNNIYKCVYIYRPRRELTLTHSQTVLVAYYTRGIYNNAWGAIRKLPPRGDEQKIFHFSFFTSSLYVCVCNNTLLLIYPSEKMYIYDDQHYTNIPHVVCLQRNQVSNMMHSFSLSLINIVLSNKPFSFSFTKQSKVYKVLHYYIMENIHVYAFFPSFIHGYNCVCDSWYFSNN